MYAFCGLLSVPNLDVHKLREYSALIVIFNGIPVSISSIRGPCYPVRPVSASSTFIVQIWTFSDEDFVALTLS